MSQALKFAIERRDSFNRQAKTPDKEDGDAVKETPKPGVNGSSTAHAPPSPRSAPPNIRDEAVQFFVASIAARLPLLGVRLPRPRIC